MPHEVQTNPSEDEIRVRSYLIWEREGCPEGKSEEHWLRAKAELEAEFESDWRAASMDGESTTFVLPLLPISSPPSRSVSGKIGSEADPAPANAARR
ncbi:MAG: DUF2934 domain-containing protein [Rhizomicrobium sp.]|jgi:hypothetical protein